METAGKKHSPTCALPFPRPELILRGFAQDLGFPPGICNPTDLQTLPRDEKSSQGTNPDPRRPWQHSPPLCYPHFFLCRSSEGQFQALGLPLRAPPVLRPLSLFPGSALRWPQPTGRDAFIPISSQSITALSTNTFPRKQLLLGAGSAWDPVTLIVTSSSPQPLPRFGIGFIPC